MWTLSWLIELHLSDSNKEYCDAFRVVSLTLLRKTQWYIISPNKNVKSKINTGQFITIFYQLIHLLHWNLITLNLDYRTFHSKNIWWGWGVLKTYKTYCFLHLVQIKTFKIQLCISDRMCFSLTNREKLICFVDLCWTHFFQMRLKVKRKQTKVEFFINL